MSIHRPEAISLFDPAIATEAVLASFRKLDPRDLVRNPVMFTTGIVALLSTILFCRDVALGIGDHVGVIGQIAAWLWFTVIFANFAEAVAEGRGKAQAESLRRTKTETEAKKVVPPSAGTFPTHGWLFVALLIAVIVVVSGLIFFPVLALGPIVEQLSLAAGTLF